jgi:hypothetical protein
MQSNAWAKSVFTKMLVLNLAHYIISTQASLFIFPLRMLCHLFVEHQYTNSLFVPNGECLGGNTAA